MHSMAHPRRSRGERILAAGGHKDGRFVVRIRILCPDAPQTHGHPSREGAIGGVRARDLCAILANLRFLRTISGTGNELRARTPRA